MRIDTFLSTVILMVDTLDYEHTPANLRDRYNAVMGFRPVRHSGVSAARQIAETGAVNGFEAAVGDYHVRPVNANLRFTDDEGWIVKSDIFHASYEWLGGNSDTDRTIFDFCRKSVPTWVYDTTRLDPWEGAVIVSTLGADQPLYYGDWLAIGVHGEMWPIEAAKHTAYEVVEGVR